MLIDYADVRGGDGHRAPPPWRDGAAPLQGRAQISSIAYWDRAREHALGRFYLWACAELTKDRERCHQTISRPLAIAIVKIQCTGCGERASLGIAISYLPGQPHCLVKKPLRCVLIAFVRYDQCL